MSGSCVYTVEVLNRHLGRVKETKAVLKNVGFYGKPFMHLFNISEIKYQVYF